MLIRNFTYLARGPLRRAKWSCTEIYIHPITQLRYNVLHFECMAVAIKTSWILNLKIMIVDFYQSMFLTSENKWLRIKRWISMYICKFCGIEEPDMTWGTHLMVRSPNLHMTTPKKLWSLIYIKVCDEYNIKVGRYQLVKDLQSSQFQMIYR